MTRADTRSASSEPFADRIVPASLRPALAQPYGPVEVGPAAARRIRALGRFASCGDRVTLTALAAGRRPFLAVVDYRTQRVGSIDPRAFDSLRASGRVVRVTNPPGTLSSALWTAIHERAASGGGLVEVDGEEDLASLALVSALPDGATVIYGIPGEGISFVAVDAGAKERVQELIARMEVRSPRPWS